MKCPVDKSDMVVVEHRKIELDYCLECSGVWFDAEELDLLVSALQSESSVMSDNDLLTPQAADVKEARRRCPVCGRNMDKAWIGRLPRALIDACPEGDGLWFDGGELHQVLHQLHGVGVKDVISFLGETFQANNQPE
jgi:Zn-finger nucleic acid-binding protein